MLSHDNIVFNTLSSVQTSKLRFASERIISYLPLSHIAAQLVDTFMGTFIGATVFFAQPDALKGSLLQTLNEVKPTIFFGVPRVWEKFHEKIEKGLTELSKFKLSIFNWATKVGFEHTNASFRGASAKNVSFFIANILILNKIKARLGFDQCRIFYSGAAPINKKTLEFFIGLGFPLCEAFGMSESTGPHLTGLTDCNRIATVGYCKSSFNKTIIVLSMLR